MEHSYRQSSSISFHCKGFRYPFLSSIFIIMQCGFIAMMLSFAVGLPVFLSVALLIGGIVLGIGFIGGHTNYYLDKEGVVQEFMPFNWMPVKLKPLVRAFNWADIKSYKIGSDLSRSLRQYNYLYISVRKKPYQLRLSDDQADKISLQNFAKAFELAIEKDTVENKKFSMSASEIPIAKTLRKPDFYRTRFAHIVFWFFIIVFVGIALAMFAVGQFKLSYMWRFGIIILPGIGYMAYRLFGKGRRE